MKQALFLLLILVSAKANVAEAALTLPNLSQQNLETIVKEFSANFTYTSASSPSSMGKKIFPYLGFELGVAGGITKSPELDALVTSETIDKIPHLGIFLALSFPEGLAVESLFIPEKKIKDVETSYTALAGKWTVTDSFWEWIPVDIAVRAHWARASLEIRQTINNSSTANQNVNATIEVDNTVWGANASVGHTFLGVIEPYAGVGFLKGKGEAKVSGTTNATIFVGTGFSGLQTSASSSPSSVALFGGVQFHIFVANLSVEAMRAFGTNNYTAKFSFDF